MMNERGIRRAAAMPGGGPQASVPVIVGDGTADSIAKRNWNTSARDEVNGPRLPPLGKAENSSKRRSRQMMLPRMRPNTPYLSTRLFGVYYYVPLPIAHRPLFLIPTPASPVPFNPPTKHQTPNTWEDPTLTPQLCNMQISTTWTTHPCPPSPAPCMLSPSPYIAIHIFHPLPPTP